MKTATQVLRTRPAALLTGLLLTLIVPMVAQADMGPWGAQSSFDYDTESPVQVEISIIRPDGTPGSARRIEFLESREDLGLPPRLIDQGITDDYGFLAQQVRVPGHMDRLIVRAAVIGQENQIEVALDDSGLIIHEFDGQRL